MGVALVTTSNWFLSGILLCLVGMGVPLFAYYPTLKRLRVVVKSGQALAPPSHETNAAILMLLGAVVIAVWFIVGAFNNQDLSNLRYMTNAQLRQRTKAEVARVRQLLIDDRQLEDQAMERYQHAWRSLIPVPVREPTAHDREAMAKVEEQLVYERDHAFERAMEEFQLNRRVNCQLLRDELRRRLQMSADASMDHRYEQADMAGGQWPIISVADDLEAMSLRLPRETYRERWHDFLYGYD
jgi:hypothetical protein